MKTYHAFGSVDNLDEVVIKSMTNEDDSEQSISEWRKAGGLVVESDGRVYLAEGDGRVKYVLV